MINMKSIMREMEALLMDFEIDIFEMASLNDNKVSKAIILEIQEKMKGISDINVKGYKEAVILSHKIYFYALVKYRSLKGCFIKERKYLDIKDNTLVLKRKLKSDEIVDINYFATMTLQGQLSKITSTKLKEMEEALQLTSTQIKKDTKNMQLVKQTEKPNACQLITAKILGEALEIGKADTIDKDKYSRVLEFNKDKHKASAIITKPRFEIDKTLGLTESQIEIYKNKLMLTEIDTQNCIMLYSLAKHYSRQLQNKSLFCSLDTIGNFIGKNLRGENGKSFIESLNRLSSFRLQYEFEGDSKNPTVAKLLTGYYNKKIEETDFKNEKIRKFTSNYITSDILETSKGTYFEISFPLLKMFDELGQFEDNVDPKIFSHSNSNEYLIVTIGLKLASYSRMGLNSIYLKTLMESIGIWHDYQINNKKGRFLNALCKKIYKASRYIKNISPIKIEATSKNIEQVKLNLMHVISDTVE